jgi:hypothetical protein
MPAVPTGPGPHNCVSKPDVTVGVGVGDAVGVGVGVGIIK